MILSLLLLKPSSLQAWKKSLGMPEARKLSGDGLYSQLSATSVLVSMW